LALVFEDNSLLLCSSYYSRRLPRHPVIKAAL